MTEFQLKHPEFGQGLLSFVLEFLLANKWPSNTLMGDYNECDEECVVGQTETCGCTCTTDPFDWTDDEVSFGGASSAACPVSGIGFAVCVWGGGVGCVEGAFSAVCVCDCLLC